MWTSKLAPNYKNMKTNNIDTIFEIGPKNVLSKLIKKIEPSIEVKSLDKIGDLVDSGFNIGIKK